MSSHENGARQPAPLTQRVGGWREREKPGLSSASTASGRSWDHGADCPGDSEHSWWLLCTANSHLSAREPPFRFLSLLGT